MYDSRRTNRNFSVRLRGACHSLRGPPQAGIAAGMLESWPISRDTARHRRRGTDDVLDSARNSSTPFASLMTRNLN